MVSAMYSESVDVLRAPFKVDKYGNSAAERDWVNATRTSVTAVAVQPDGSDEGTGGRSTVTTGLLLMTPIGRDMDLLPSDRVDYRGTVYNVVGEVARFRVGRRVHHIEAHLRRVTG